MIFDLGILFFAAVVLFHTVTLPVELNASQAGDPPAGGLEDH